MLLSQRRWLDGLGGRNSVAECQLPKLDVVGSNPIARSSLHEGLRRTRNPFRVVAAQNTAHVRAFPRSSEGTRVLRGDSEARAAGIGREDAGAEHAGDLGREVTAASV